MIITIHLLAGAAIVARIGSVPLGLLLALVSHYFLDILPHQDYNLDNIKRRLWKKTPPEFLKIFVDAVIGFFLVSLFTPGFCLGCLGAFAAILPDCLLLIHFVFPKNRLLRAHYRFHHWIHFPEDKKTILFWKMIFPLLLLALTLYLLTGPFS